MTQSSVQGQLAHPFVVRDRRWRVRIGGKADPKLTTTAQQFCHLRVATRRPFSRGDVREDDAPLWKVQTVVVSEASADFVGLFWNPPRNELVESLCLELPGALRQGGRGRFAEDGGRQRKRLSSSRFEQEGDEPCRPSVTVHHIWIGRKLTAAAQHTQQLNGGKRKERDLLQQRPRPPTGALCGMLWMTHGIDLAAMEPGHQHIKLKATRVHRQAGLSKGVHGRVMPGHNEDAAVAETRQLLEERADALLRRTCGMQRVFVGDLNDCAGLVSPGGVLDHIQHPVPIREVRPVRLSARASIPKRVFEPSRSLGANRDLATSRPFIDGYVRDHLPCAGEIRPELGLESLDRRPPPDGLQCHRFADLGQHDGARAFL